MRDLLERQLEETDRSADASRVMLEIAQKNDEMAREFNATVQNLVRSGQEFESEVTSTSMGVSGAHANSETSRRLDTAGGGCPGLPSACCTVTSVATSRGSVARL